MVDSGSPLGEDALGHDAVVAAVRAVLDEHVAVGVTMVVAVSGGADSVGLLQATGLGRPDLELIVAHVRHGLRDDQADHDAALQSAERAGARFVATSVQVREGQGPEDAARRARYAALAQIVAQTDAHGILLGHTMDDQAETVLLRIARGTGIDGLAGMSAVDVRDGVRLIRPLLQLRRSAVRATVAADAFVDDPTNLDEHQRRARARSEVLPALARLHPAEADPVPFLARLADNARADRDVIQQVMDTVRHGVLGPAVLVPRTVGGIGLSGEGLAVRLLRAGWAHLPGHPSPISRDTVIELARLPHGGIRDCAGGVRVTSTPRGWVLDSAPDLRLPPRDLPVGGHVVLDEIGLRLDATPVVAAQPAAEPSSPRQPVGGQDGLRTWDMTDAPWEVDVPCDGPVLRVGGRPTPGARQVREHLRVQAPEGLRHLVVLIADADGEVLAVGSRAVKTLDAGSRRVRVKASRLR